MKLVFEEPHFYVERDYPLPRVIIGFGVGNLTTVDVADIKVSGWEDALRFNSMPMPGEDSTYHDNCVKRMVAYFKTYEDNLTVFLLHSGL